MRQGRQRGRWTALGPPSPPSLLVLFSSLGRGLQTQVWLRGASWAPGRSLGYGFGEVCGSLVLEREKRGLKD